MNRRREPASWLGWKHGWHVLTDSVDSAAGCVDSALARLTEVGGHAFLAGDGGKWGTGDGSYV